MAIKDPDPIIGRPQIFLTLATPEAIESWSKILRDDARKHGGTATVMLRHPYGGVVKITVCAQVVIIDHISDAIDAAWALVRWQAEIEEELKALAAGEEA